MTYSLTGVVVHTRISETCGHYRAFVRSTKDSTQWFSVDDLKVHGLCMVSTYFGVHAAQPSLTSFGTHAGNPSKCCNSSPSRALYAILPSPRRYTHGCHLVFYVDVT